jgi:hypothetical protein
MDGASSTLLAPDPATSPSSDASYPPASPTHHLPNSSFHNPWIAPAVENATGAGIAANSWAKLSQTVLNTKFPFEWAKALHNDKHPVQPVKVVKPNFGRETEGAEGLIKATWLGHAVCSLFFPLIFTTMFILANLVLSSRNARIISERKTDAYPI